MLELKQRKGEDPAKYAHQARRISEHIDPKYDHLLTLKLRDGFRSKTLQIHLSVDSEAPEKFTFETVYKRFLSLNKISLRKQKKKEWSDSFSSSESESDSESDTDTPKKEKKAPASTGYDSDESTSSSSDDEPIKKKKSANRNEQIGRTPSRQSKS